MKTFLTLNILISNLNFLKTEKQLVDTNWNTEIRDIQSDNDYEEKIPYTFLFIKVKRYHEGNENQRKVCIYGIFSS